jgi:ABC-type sulfate transport system substrate-binding protein
MKTKANEIEIAKGIRFHLIKSIEMLASKEKQLEFQANAPIAAVSSEIFNNWDGNYHPSGIYLPYAFSEKELEILAEFNVKIDEILSSMPEIMPHINEFQAMPEWQRLTSAAQTALNKLEQLNT